MKLNFLGTSGWFGANGNNTICTLLETKDNYILFDVGDGVYKLERYIKSEKPIIIFLSHFHFDHIVGFHIFSRFKFKNKVTVVCPENTKKILESLIASPFTCPLEKLTINLKIIEKKEGKHKEPINFECRKICHADLTFGYALDVENKKIIYLCDTSICENSLALLKNADVALHECSVAPEHVSEAWGHTNPKDAARFSKKLGVGKLFLTHFSPFEYESLENIEEAEKIARKIFPETFCAKDDMSVEV